MFQDKAQPAVNGYSLNKGCPEGWMPWMASTAPYGGICEPPSGRDEKPSSAV